MVALESPEEAVETVGRVTQETKLLYSEYYSGQTGNKVHLRPENIQYTGAYRVRGAYYKINTPTDEEKARGLITTSTGNCVQSAAYVTKLTGIKVTIMMSVITPLIKVNRIGGYGAEVVLVSDVFDEACVKAHELMNEFGYTFAHPFDDLAVVTRQGTIVMETIKELPTVDCILAFVGSDGLCAGVSTLVKLLNPRIEVIGVEPTGANRMQESLKASHVADSPDMNTIAGGTAVKCPGEKIPPYIQENVNDITIIEGSELIAAFLDMVENYKMMVGSSDLLTMAALKHVNVEKEKIVFVLSGGNMDVIAMASIVQHGLIQRDRVLTVPMFLLDKSGEFTKASAPLVKEQDNVTKLEYDQLISINRNAAVELRITIGAYGTEHRNTIIQTLNDVEYHPELVKFKGTYTE